ncbi:MAG: hypothetical protein Q9165_007942 [Trypethelium subeluteriae]
MGILDLVIILVAVTVATPLKKQAGQTYISIGQNYLNEWQSFQSGIKSPAGISTYGDIWSGALNSDSQDLLAGYAASGTGFVEVGMSWKDAMTNNGYTQFQGAQLCHDIANGKYDNNLNALGSYLATFANVKYIFRVDYEVSGNLHANTNPTAFDENTWDLTAYPEAFAHVRNVISGKVSDIEFIFHPVRGEAQLLYPGDDVVDYQGVSIFNNDVCLPVGSTSNCDGSVLDPNVLKDIQFATKPKWVAESSVQPPASDATDDFITYLTRVKNMIEEYDFAGWTYINSNWPIHGWSGDTWGDSRIETNSPIKDWYESNIVGDSRYVFA